MSNHSNTLTNTPDTVHSSPAPWYYRTSTAQTNTTNAVNIEICSTVYKESNAQLIAAAPDLLAALELLTSELMFDSAHCYEDYFKVAQQAIAKAKGLVYEI